MVNACKCIGKYSGHAGHIWVEKTGFYKVDPVTSYIRFQFWGPKK